MKRTPIALLAVLAAGCSPDMAFELWNHNNDPETFYVRGIGFENEEALEVPAEDVGFTMLEVDDSDYQLGRMIWA